jgi:hypothetical protein
MKAFWIAITAAIVIAIIGAVGLNSVQTDAEMAYHSPSGVRI